MRTRDLELLEQAMEEELPAELLLHRSDFGYQGGREGPQMLALAEDGIYVVDVEHLVVGLMKSVNGEDAGPAAVCVGPELEVEDVHGTRSSAD